MKHSLTVLFTMQYSLCCQKSVSMSVHLTVTSLLCNKTKEFAADISMSYGMVIPLVLWLVDGIRFAP